MAYPVEDIVSELQRALKSHSVVILQAPPGAGKSTIVPLRLLDEPWLSKKKIMLLQPRRLAAKSVAGRMAELSKEEVGQQIGYRIRFESKVSVTTKVEVVTEGILIRMIQHDNLLEEVGLIIFDEFHERSLQADLALALSLQIQEVVRKDLKILLMSATLDVDNLSKILNDAPVLRSTGKQFPVDVRYIGYDEKIPVVQQTTRIIRKVLREEAGDMLVFLPGAGEIRRTKELLDEDKPPAKVYALYGDLPYREQQEAILPSETGYRKIVLATNIAETSLTIEGIRVVIDSGLERVPRFDPRSGFTRLDTVRITKDSADQRAGRAGRLGPGVCYRLWSEAMHRNLAAHRTPEILEADLASLMLELYAWGINHVRDLNWVTVPPAGAVSQAIELLESLEAISNNKITARGKKMADLPTHPRIAHMLTGVFGSETELALACDVASLLEERDPMPVDTGADLTLRLEMLRRYRAGITSSEGGPLARIEKLSAAWRRQLNLKAFVSNETVSDYDVGRLIALAYPERIAKRTKAGSEQYKLTNGRVARLPAHDPLMKEEWIAIAQLDQGNNEGKIFLAAPLAEADLQELSRVQTAVRWDSERGLVECVEETCVGSLVLFSRILSHIPEEKRIQVICKAVQKEGLQLIGWNEDTFLLQNRILSLRTWRPEEAWPDLTDVVLLQNVHEWLPPFLGHLTKRTELQRLNANQILLSLLPWELQNKLDMLAPDRLEVPSGSLIRIKYSANGDLPIMEVRLQECFGMLRTPTVNEGRTPLVLHLLSPGYKPVQVTQDLESFWKTAYHEVRKELRRRYPKHSWPEDPMTAKAVRGVVRRK
ncbi:MAG: ATP-dependent helicase HrpB [Cyclobacteriaceae bacterium]